MFDLQIRPVLEGVAADRDQPAMMPLNVRDRPKPIELQLQDSIGVIEGFWG